MGIVGVAEDGSRVLAQSSGSISDPEDISPIEAQYEFVRGRTGWEATTTSVDAPFSEFPAYSVNGISPDFQSTLVFAATPGQAEASGVYLRPPGGSPVPVGPLIPSEGAEGLAVIGASDDLHRSLYLTHSPQGREISSLWPGDTTAAGVLPSLYEYEYTGEYAKEPRLVGIKNEGAPKTVGEGELISNCGTYLGSFSEAEGDMYNAVAASGAATFFTAAKCGKPGPPVNEVYARFEGTLTMAAHTVAVSEPPLSVPERKCTGACENAETNLLGRNEGPGERQEASFVGASLDGSRVFFLTRQSLVNGDENGEGTGRDLYEADIGNGAVTRLIQVSHGGEGDLSPGSGAGVLGVARVSQDGSHVYFVAEGALTGANKEGKTPAPLAQHRPNLYVSSRECPGGENVCTNPAEHTSFVAILSTGDGSDWSSNDSRPVQATPDGQFLVFQSTADLTPDQEGRPEAGQVFEYDAATETLVRVSRGQGGYNGDGNSNEYSATIPVQNYEREIPVGIGRITGLAVSADGSRVFFSSMDALAPQALNGVMNVYEYHNRQVGLISDGHDTGMVRGKPVVKLIGTDESGLDVFFTTVDQLVPQDTDAQVDVYDARVEGGFAPPAVAAPCSGDSCQTTPSVPPTLLLPGSLSMAETPGPVSKPKAASKTRPGKRKRKARRGGKLRKSRGVHRGRKTTTTVGKR